MQAPDWLAEQFEENRGHLRGVAFRMLGSLTEADDAVQEAWLRLSRSDAGEIQNLGGWLTTVVARVCLDILRSRTSRREESLGATNPSGKADPEQEALLADSVGLALLVVLERLTPAERLAFVLHDVFAVSFDEIAPIVGRTPAAARQLASRARRRVQGPAAAPGAALAEQRDLVGAFLSALRAGDVDGLVAVLDPGFALHTDQAAAIPGAPEVQGAREWAKQAIRFARGAASARPALIDGAVGVIVAPRGRLFRVVRLTFTNGKIARADVVGDPATLRALDLAVL